EAMALAAASDLADVAGEAVVAVPQAARRPTAARAAKPPVILTAGRVFMGIGSHLGGNGLMCPPLRRLFATESGSHGWLIAAISGASDRAGRGASRPGKTKARVSGLRSSEDRAGFGRGRSLEGLSLWMPSLSDSPTIGRRWGWMHPTKVQGRVGSRPCWRRSLVARARWSSSTC